MLRASVFRLAPWSCRFPPRGSAASASELTLPALALTLPGEGEQRPAGGKRGSPGSTRHWRGTRQLGRPSTKPCDGGEPKVEQNMVAPVGHRCPSGGAVLELEPYSLEGSGLPRGAHSGVTSCRNAPAEERLFPHRTARAQILLDSSFQMTLGALPLSASVIPINYTCTGILYNHVSPPLIPYNPQHFAPGPTNHDLSGTDYVTSK